MNLSQRFILPLLFFASFLITFSIPFTVRAWCIPGTSWGYNCAVSKDVCQTVALKSGSFDVSAYDACIKNASQPNDSPQTQTVPTSVGTALPSAPPSKAASPAPPPVPTTARTQPSPIYTTPGSAIVTHNAFEYKCKQSAFGGINYSLDIYNKCIAERDSSAQTSASAPTTNFADTAYCTGQATPFGGTLNKEAFDNCVSGREWCRDNPEYPQATCVQDYMGLESSGAVVETVTEKSAPPTAQSDAKRILQYVNQAKNAQTDVQAQLDMCENSTCVQSVLDKTSSEELQPTTNQDALNLIRKGAEKGANIQKAQGECNDLMMSGHITEDQYSFCVGDRLGYIQNSPLQRQVDFNALTERAQSIEPNCRVDPWTGDCLGSPAPAIKELHAKCEESATLPIPILGRFIGPIQAKVVACEKQGLQKMGIWQPEEQTTTQINEQTPLTATQLETSQKVKNISTSCSNLYTGKQKEIDTCVSNLLEINGLVPATSEEDNNTNASTPSSVPVSLYDPLNITGMPVLGEIPAPTDYTGPDENGNYPNCTAHQTNCGVVYTPDLWDIYYTPVEQINFNYGDVLERTPTYNGPTHQFSMAVPFSDTLFNRSLAASAFGALFFVPEKK